MELMMLFPDGKEKALTFSYDDGVEQDKRLIDILNANGLKGTFNLNSGVYAKEGTVYPEGTIHRRMSFSEVMNTYKDSGHEVAVHGLTHPFLEKLPAGQAAFEIIEDRKNLEQQFKTIVRGMAYPFGTYNDEVVQILKNAGIVYARKVETTRQFSIPNDWLQLEGTCHHNDPELMNLAKRFLEEKPRWNPFLFYVWGHSYEFEENDNWNVIEEFANYIGGHDEVWYATNIQICDYVNAFRQLQFSLDRTMVKNPTSQTVWFALDDKVIKIEPGEVLVAG